MSPANLLPEMSPAPSSFSLSYHQKAQSMDCGSGLHMPVCDCERQSLHAHKRQISQGTQELLDRLDDHEKRMGQIVMGTQELLERLDDREQRTGQTVQLPPSSRVIGTQELLDRLEDHEQRMGQIVQLPPSPRVMHRQNTQNLIERLDEHTQEVQRLLHVGADLLADDGKLGCCTTFGDLSTQSTAELDNSCLSIDVDEFGEASSTTASSNEDLCSELSTPCSFRLVRDDEEAQRRNLLGRFNLWLAAEELKCLHSEIHAFRRHFSVSQASRLSKAVDALTSAFHRKTEDPSGQVP